MVTKPSDVPSLQDLLQKLTLEEHQKSALAGRLIDQIEWMSGRSKKNKTWYFRLRFTAIIAGALIPALVSIDQICVWGVTLEAKWIVCVLGLMVSIASALEEFFRFGENWRHYRQSNEALKTEGWQFVQQIGNYASEQYPTHAKAYSKFAARVEEILQREVGVYVTEVMGKQDDKKSSTSANEAVTT